MARTPKGEVSIENIDGWIRHRRRIQGQRKTMSLGLRHDPVNLAVAQQRANQIRLDMVSGNYQNLRSTPAKLSAMAGGVAERDRRE